MRDASTIRKLTMPVLRWRTNIFLLGLSFIMLTNGCSIFRTTGGRVQWKAASTRLVMINGKSNELRTFQGRSKEDNKIAQECKVDEIISEEPFLPPVAGEAVDWIFDKIDQKLRELLEKYSAVYTAKTTVTDFYKETDTPVLKWSCFRFSRFEAKNNELVVDLVGQLRLSPNHDALQIRPLRLYWSNARAESTDNNYGIAASMRVNAIWLDGNRGRSENVFNHVFLKTKRKLVNTDSTSPSSNVEYFLEEDWKNYPLLPLPPWSTCPKCRSLGTGNVEIVMNMAESGNAPALLKLAAKLFKSSREDLAELLNEAVK